MYLYCTRFVPLCRYAAHDLPPSFAGLSTQAKGRRWHRCDCPIWVQGSLAGEYVRQSLNLAVWGAAQERVRGWEASGQVRVIRNEIPPVKEAVEKHIADAEARNLKPESVKKIKDVIERRLLAYCSNQGYRSLRQLDVDAVREFRNEFVKDYSANSARKRLEYVRAFFRFCHQSGWMVANPGVAIKPPKADQAPTMPFANKHKLTRCSMSLTRSTRVEDSDEVIASGSAR